MKRMEPSSAFVKKGIRSAGLVRAGPDVICRVVPSSWGRTLAKVVLPSPGGPSSKIWGSGSLSFLQAFTAMLNRFITAFCPITSAKHRGLRAESWGWSPEDPPVADGDGDSVPGTFPPPLKTGSLAMSSLRHKRRV